MNDPGTLGYVAIFTVTLILALALVPIALRIAVQRGLLDLPGGHKGHASPVPYLGGAAMALAFCASIGAAALLSPPEARLGELVVILGCAAGLAVVGLVDDLRSLPPWPKLVAVVVAAVAVQAGGVRVDVSQAAAVDYLVGAFWIVGITNAFNLLDNMDALSAGVAAIAAGTFAVLAIQGGQFLVASLALALAATALGFLRHNAPPAKIYMGDAGSLFLGFLLAVIGIKLRFPDLPRTVSVLVPITVLMVAVLDTTVTVVDRLANRRSPFVGGRDHLSHRLVHIGVPPPIAVVLLHVGALAAGWLGVVLSRMTDPATAWLLFGLAAFIAVLIGGLIGTVPVHGQARSHLRWGAATSGAIDEPSRGAAAAPDATVPLPRK